MPQGSPETQGHQFVAPYYEARWASLAVDSTNGAFGSSGESKTEGDAQKSAEAECASKGGRTCHAIATSKNSCVTMVASDSTIFGDGGPTQKAAEEKAMKNCAASNSTNCYVYFSKCVEPVIR
jgi:hypothetical protein